MIDKELIISYINSGLSVVPVNGDNGRPAKAPATTEWKKYPFGGWLLITEL